MPRIRKLPEVQREINISIFLKKALLEKGWKNQHLAELLGMDASQVSKIINHPLKCEIRTLLKVSDKLGVNLLNPEI